MRVIAHSPAALARRRQCRAPSAPLALTLRVLVKRRRLDREIASGCPRGSTPEHSLRIRQLLSPWTRRRLASTLRDTVEYVDRVGSRPNFSAVVIERAAVRAGREAILGLAERLDGPDPVSPAGIVLASILLSDGLESPLFNRHCKRSVVEAVWEVADALGAASGTVEFDALTG